MSGPVSPEAVHKLCEGCGRSVLLAVLVLQPRRRLLCARCYRKQAAMEARRERTRAAMCAAYRAGLIGSWDEALDEGVGQ